MATQHRNPTLFYGYQLQGTSGSTTAGTAATGTHKAFGSGTGTIEEASNNHKIRTIGAAALNYIKGGGLVTTATYTFDSIHKADPLLLINRAGGLLDWFTISGGFNETTDFGWHITDCKASSLALRLGGGNQPGLLTGTITALGKTLAKDTAAEVVTDPTTGPFISYEAVLTVGGSAFEATGMDLTIANQLEPLFVIAGAARSSGKKRFFDYLVEGNIDVTGSFTVLEDPSVSVAADCLTSQACVLRLIDACDSSNIINVAMTGVTWDSETLSVPNEGAMGITIPFTAKTAVISNS